MRTSVLTAASAAVLGGGLLLAAPGAVSAAPAPSSAYGLQVFGGGQGVIPPSPRVESTDGTTNTTGGDIPDNPLLTGGVLRLTAGDGFASVEGADLTIGGVVSQLPQQVQDGLSELQAACDGLAELPIEQFPDVIGQIPLPLPDQPTESDLVAFCNEVFDGDSVDLGGIQGLDVSCEGDQATVVVAGASLLGAEVPVEGEVAEGTALFPDNPLLDVTLNRQSEDADGALTVDGVVVSLAGGQGELVLASATCGEPAAHPDRTPPPAPVPTPTPADVAVTG